METTNDNLIDKQLYISMQQGNKKAFDTLFIKYYAMLCAFARSFVSLEDAEEVVQDTMLQIWENRKTNHIDSSVHHYLFKAVKNKCYTLMTRNSLRFQIENILTPDIQELFEDPDFYIIEELTQKIEKAILNLPESYRVACLLYTSDAADEEDSVDLGGRRITKKKKHIIRLLLKIGLTSNVLVKITSQII